MEMIARQVMMRVIARRHKRLALLSGSWRLGLGRALSVRFKELIGSL
jgi:hypothetical protein